MSRDEPAVFPFKIIDLTHSLSPDTPAWPGDPKVTCSVHTSHEKEGYALNRWCLGEHTSTHLGAPLHFEEDSVGIDVFSDFLLPLSVIDFLGERSNHRRSVLIDDLMKEERREGFFMQNGAVILRTGWNDRWPDENRIFQQDAQGRWIYPGFSADSIRWLVEERGMKIVGTDAPGIDAGDDSAFLAGKMLAKLGGFHLENLDLTQELPRRGGWLFTAPLPLKQGTGSPARVFALVPE